MGRLFNLLCLVFIVISASALADTKNILVEIGGVRIYVQAPIGFHEISTLSPETRKLAETMTPPKNRLLAVFVSEDDLGRIMKGEAPQFERYMFLQVFRELENSNISTAQFQQLVAQVKEQQNTLQSKLKKDVATLVEGAAEKMSKEYELSLKIKMGEQVPLGVFYEKHNAVGFSSLGKYQVETEGEKLDHVVASGTSFILTRSKILYAYVYGAYKGQSDLNWVRSKSKEWANSLLSLNKTSKALSGHSYGSTSAPGIDWERVIDKAIVGAFAGGLIALFIGGFQGVKRLFKKREDDAE